MATRKQEMGSQACTVKQGWVCIQLEKSNYDFQPICGNGILEFGINEGCDDGKFLNGDGCSNACIVEPARGPGEIFLNAWRSLYVGIITKMKEKLVIMGTSTMEMVVVPVSKLR